MSDTKAEARREAAKEIADRARYGTSRAWQLATEEIADLLVENERLKREVDRVWGQVQQRNTENQADIQRCEALEAALRKIEFGAPAFKYEMIRDIARAAFATTEPAECEGCAKGLDRHSTLAWHRIRDTGWSIPCTTTRAARRGEGE